MEWKYVKQLESIETIKDFECLAKYKFNKSFIECVSENNAGRPIADRFDTETTKERTIKTLLSFNPNDKENIWEMFIWNNDILPCAYVAFAIDHFGNLICFRKNDGCIIFFDHETGAVEYVAKNFEGFLSILK